MGDCQYLSSLDTYLWPDIMAKLYVQKDTFQFKNRHLPKNQKYQNIILILRCIKSFLKKEKNTYGIFGGMMFINSRKNILI